MNKENAKDYLPLVQALADGKDLEWHDNDGKWHPVDEAGFGYEAARYRIKPEPREFWVVECVFTVCGPQTWLYETEDAARKVAASPWVQDASGEVHVYKVREVCS